MNLSTSNLFFAKSFFKKKLSKLSNIQIEELFKKLVNKFKFNFYEIDAELDVYVTFETMNNRGKSLSNLELLKNRLIYISTLLSDEIQIRERLRKDINETWKTIYEYLGKSKDNPLDDDYFLYNHWIMYFKYDRSQSDAYAQFLLHEKFVAKDVIKGILQFKEIKNYIDSLAECVKHWFFIHNIQFSSYTDETKEWFQKIDRIGMSAFPPLLMASMSTSDDETKLLQLLKTAERFNFLVFKLSQRPSNTKNSHFYRLAHMLYFQAEWGDDYTTIDKVVENIEWLIEGTNDEEEYIGWFDLEKFYTLIKDLAKKDQGYYSWNGLRYFLFEYEIFLKDIARGNTKVNWEDFNKRKKEDTIEHIYPQTPTEDCWIDAFHLNNKKQKRAILNSLGNLLLLSQSKNSELQNYCFEYKKKHKNKKDEDVGFFNGSYSEIEVSSYKQWTENEVKKRGLNMLKFMEDRWNIKMKDWDIDKTDLLNLKFEEETK